MSSRYKMDSEGAKMVKCIKIFTIFPAPDGMWLTKLSLGGSKSYVTSLFPPRESLVSDIPAGNGNIEKLYLRCREGLFRSSGIQIAFNYLWEIRDLSFLMSFLSKENSPSIHLLNFWTLGLCESFYIRSNTVR
jgi:hypothetical protein